MIEHLVLVERHRMRRLSVFFLQAMLAVGARHRGRIGSHLYDHFHSLFDKNGRPIVTIRSHWNAPPLEQVEEYSTEVRSSQPGQSPADAQLMHFPAHDS